METNVKIWTVGIIVGLGIAAVVGIAIFQNSQPGKLDDFAKCLKDKGAVFYGAFWCPHCQDEKALFGNSAKHLPYVECSTADSQGQLPVCKNEKIEVYPTWKFADGTKHEGEMSLKELAEKRAVFYQNNMTIIEIINIKLALGTIIAQIFLLAVVIWFFLFKKNYPLPFLAKHGMLLAFITALASTLASLFYSNIVGFPPCDLCWFQRIFMYPLVIILAMALIKKNKAIAEYALAVAVPGLLISLYHNYIYYFNQGLGAKCLLGGVGVSCVKRYVFEFGYITIPLMALTAFVLVIVFLLFAKHNTASK